MNTSDSPLRIDIISDVMCPWCIIGYRQLAKALDATSVEHEVHWHPFELNPNMPPEGQDGVEHIAEKYGATPEQSKANRKQMTDLGDQLGFEFGFQDGFRMHNTFNTHQLLHWAEDQDRKHDLKMALFTAHFTNRRDLSDNAVLADIAGEIGLDRDEALAVLSDQRFAKNVRDIENFWVQQGIQGVPAVVFDRQHLVTGAQGVENYTSILNQLAKTDA
ncbi:DsbA family oxidoreductase [Sulfitobacter donghicola]|uniref:Thioredoxin n=1 Tax=Sulfitobacter donghicola DSW-25 = KCTC 12864 = JCM 14565 TaxID=1300350 RepID=A0A073IYZ6_9RHOB|nr:DsbA family oxidoreductase [Sulfitobacter donghicola]KEJ90607.1 thioredoxin [Sulfitobacter donghicola DSW-25 = KCTC 12864 = JCM 14565]KIN67856.1 putative DSBA oxidoreductase [Sulfitobacter donghicola DSW-25 = KCTC 12864 = JCM 14565]